MPIVMSSLLLTGFVSDSLLGGGWGGGLIPLLFPALNPSLGCWLVLISKTSIPFYRKAAVVPENPLHWFA